MVSVPLQHDSRRDDRDQREANHQGQKDCCGKFWYPLGARPPHDHAVRADGPPLGSRDHMHRIDPQQSGASHDVQLGPVPPNDGSILPHRPAIVSADHKHVPQVDRCGAFPL